MAAPIAQTAHRASYIHALPEIAQKDIWGPTWQAFMGMSTDEGGINPVQDQPADYNRARTAESYVYRCEEVRGRAISQVPLKAWQHAKGKRIEVEHDALGVLQETNPFGYVDGDALLRYTLASLDLHGRCAWKLAFNKKNLPTEIYWQIPTQFTPLPDPTRFFRGIRVHSEWGVKEIPPEELCYFATDNPGQPLLGTSKVSVLKSAINLRQYSTRSNMDFFKNSMRPDLVVSGHWKNDDENVERLRRNWRRAFSGESNRQPFFAGDETKASLLTITPKDAEWLGQQRLSQEEISAVFGVPLIYLNNFERATYENAKTAKLLLWHDTMIPEGDIFAKLLNKRFLWRFWPDTKTRGISLGFDYGEIEGLGEDLALIWERVIKMSQQISEQVKNRELLPNQALALRNQLFSDLGVDVSSLNGVLPGGDMFYQPFGNIPIDELSTQTVIDIMAARSSNPQLEEDVPGAPNVADNAAKPNPNARQSAAPAPDKGFAPRVIRKGPHPLPVRDARLAPIQSKMARRLKRHFQDLKLQAERSMRGQSQFRDPGQPLTKPAMARAKTMDPELSLYDSQQAIKNLEAVVSEAVAASAAAAYAATREDYGLEVAWDIDNPWLAKYMGHRLPLIHDIDVNLRDRLRQVLLDEGDKGSSMPEIADAVRGVFQEAIGSRADLIARTETIQAYGRASLASYSDAGVEKAQMYDGEGDEECAAVNGMIVSLDEAEQLMADEHPNGTRGVAPFVEPLDDPGEKSLGPGIRLVA